MAEYSESIIFSDGAGGGRINGPLTVFANQALAGSYAAAGASTAIIGGSDKKSLVGAVAGDVGPKFESAIRTANAVYFDNALTAENALAIFNKYSNVNTVALGMPAIRGSDIRPAVAAVDGAVVLNFTNPSATVQAFRITVDLEGESGTITSAVYTYKFVRNGVTITKTVSISAVNTASTVVDMIQVDASSAITGQLTTLTGTTPKVDVTVLVEGITIGA